MKFLITGANGFIGRHLCNELLRQGQSVRVAMRSATCLPDGVEFVQVGTIDRDTDWMNALRGIDVVIHLAARVHVMKEFAADPLAEFLKVNLQGTENLAQQAARFAVKRFVYISSIKVNGECTFSPGIFTRNAQAKQDIFSESDKPNPQDPYAISKWQAEQALHRITHETSMEIVIVRPPLVYGPDVKGNFASLLKVIKKGIPLPFAAVNNSRSLIFVGNLVDALIVCATHPSAAGQTYIVCDGEPVSTAALVKKLAHAFGRPSRSFYFPLVLLRTVAALLGQADKVSRLLNSLQASDNKIRRELGWKPPYTFDQGISATVDWYVAQHTTVGYNRGTF